MVDCFSQWAVFYYHHSVATQIVLWLKESLQHGISGPSFLGKFLYIVCNKARWVHLKLYQPQSGGTSHVTKKLWFFLVETGK